MIVAILPVSPLSVKAGVGRHVDLTADDRIDPRLFRRLIKINNAIHNPVVRDRSRGHAQLLDPLNVLSDLIGAVQQGIFCMNMQMCKCHGLDLPSCVGL